VKISLLRNIGLAALPVLVGAGLWSASLDAADHEEAPGSQADFSADINDLYHWHTADGTSVTVLTFGGIASAEAVFDADVLYTVHFDMDGDNESDMQANVRFGQDGDGDWGMQATMGTDLGSISWEGPVGEPLVDADKGISLWAGVADDPFFFDLTGFTETIANLQDDTDASDIAFTATDALAGANTTAFVIEGPTPGAAYQVWATSGRDNG
jgi:hypothetical protein